MRTIKMTIEDSRNNIIGRSDNLNEKSKIKISPSSYRKSDTLCLFEFKKLKNYTIFITIREDNNSNRYLYIDQNEQKMTVDYNLSNDFMVNINNIFTPSELSDFLENNEIEEGFK